MLLSAKAEKVYRRLPVQVATKMLTWVSMAQALGLEEVREVPGVYDEPLPGKRLRQRSIRMNGAYRAIYIVLEHGSAK